MEKVGLFIGRFEPLTVGHCSIIDDAINKVDKLIIALGSSQAKSSIKNPYSASLRALMLFKVYEKEILSEKIIIAFVPDREHPKDDEERGKYLLENVYKQTGYQVNVIFEGSEIVRNYWFNENVTREVIDKNIIPISATKVREFIINDDYENYIKFVPKELSDREFYKVLKDILDKVSENER